MGLTTNIAWADATYNLWRGCEKVSPGCKLCYAEALAERNPKVLGKWGPNPRVVGTGEYLKTPAKVAGMARAEGARKRVFVNSIADFWDQWDGDLIDVRGNVLHVSPYKQWVTAETGHVVSALRKLTLDDVREYLLMQVIKYREIDWLILTKRPQHILPTLRRIAESTDSLEPAGRETARAWLAGEPPENLWCGVSVENQQQAWLRIEQLRMVPAAVRFLSVEPLLGELDLSPWLLPHVERDRGFGFYQHQKTCSWTAAGGCGTDPNGRRSCNGSNGTPDLPDAFHWVIVGGESGPPTVARRCHLDWIGGIVDQCSSEGVPVFVKQLGTNPISFLTDGDDLPMLLSLNHPKGEDPTEWPPSLQVQDFPAVDNTEM